MSFLELLGKTLLFIGLFMLFWRMNSGTWRLPLPRFYFRPINRPRLPPIPMENDQESQDCAICMRVLTEACGGDYTMALQLVELERVLNDQLTYLQATEAAFDRVMLNSPVYQTKRS